MYCSNLLDNIFIMFIFLKVLDIACIYCMHMPFQATMVITY